MFPDDFGVGVACLEEHELGDGTLDSHVTAADDACLLQVVATVVARHLDCALHALADVDDDLAVLCALLQGLEKPRRLGGVAAAEGAHDDGLEVGRMDDVAYEVFAYAGEEAEDDDVVVEAEVGRHGLLPVGHEDALAVVGDVDAGIDEVGVVERLEGVELLGALLGGAVAAQQVPAEVDAHLGHKGTAFGILGGCYLDARDEVLLAVGAELADGQLAAGEDDGLGEVLEHIGEGRGGVGHGVGAVKHDETVVLVVAVGNDVSNGCPSGWRHVAGVDGRIELEGVDVGGELVQFRHVLKQVLEVEGFEGTRFGVAVHADGTAGVDEEDFIHLSIIHYPLSIRFRRDIRWRGGGSGHRGSG